MPERKSPKVPTYIDQAVKVIDRWLSYKRYISRLPGLTVGIIYKDKLVFSQGYGYKDLQTKEKVTADSCFRIASISKVFTATAIMQLAESGKLNLDGVASKYLPWLKSKEGEPEVTLRQLLTHSSGFNRDGNTLHWYNDSFPDLENLETQAKLGLAVYPPNDRFKYSNLGFVILGAIVSKASGRTYEEYIQENIIQKLDLKHTYPDYEESVSGCLATGYGRDIPGKERESFNNPKTNAMAPATGFISNALDLCTFLSAQFINSGLLLSNESKREMQRIHRFQRPESRQYGLGFEIWKVSKQVVVGHGGAFAGYRTKIAMDKENRVGVALLTNAIDAPATQLINGIFHTINFFRTKKGDYELIETNDFGIYEGRYEGRWGVIEVVNINGHLLGFEPNEDKPLDKPYILEHITSNRFKIVSCDSMNYLGEEAVFELNKDGGNIAHFGPSILIKSSEDF